MMVFTWLPLQGLMTQGLTKDRGQLDLTSASSTEERAL